MLSLRKSQIKVLSDFLSDTAKIIFASAVVGFFIPGMTGELPQVVLIGGLIATTTFLVAAMLLAKSLNNH